MAPPHFFHCSFICVGSFPVFLIRPRQRIPPPYISSDRNPVLVLLTKFTTKFARTFPLLLVFSSARFSGQGAHFSPHPTLTADQGFPRASQVGFLGKKDMMTRVTCQNMIPIETLKSCSDTPCPQGKSDSHHLLQVMMMSTCMRTLAWSFLLFGTCFRQLEHVSIIHFSTERNVLEQLGSQ